jgi:hypothetical protein
MILLAQKMTGEIFVFEDNFGCFRMEHLKVAGKPINAQRN